MNEVSLPVRIVCLADTFDAMTSERPYRDPMSLGGTLNEIIRMSPLKFDPNVVQGLLLQIRRDSVGSNRVPFMDNQAAAQISPTDVDQLAAALQHKVSQNRMYLP